MSPSWRRSRVFMLCSLALLGIAMTQILPSQPTSHHAGSAFTNRLDSVAPNQRLVAVPTTNPAIQGWGGVTLDEAANGQMQATLQRLNQSGYDAVRVGFSGGTNIHCSSGELGSWDPTLFSQVIQMAQQYNMWVVLDYHSYNDLTDPTCQTEWLTFWSGVLSTNWNYGKIVWEPINEPAGSVALLSSAYRAWITQARSLGDTHWIAIENSWSNGGNPSCSFDILSIVACYPVATDPLNETFLSIHPYFFYDSWKQGGYGSCSPSGTYTWGNDTAECVANTYYGAMLQSTVEYHMPILDTEGGAVYYSCNNVCDSPPDAVGTDDASYSLTTFHFIQHLTSLMQSSSMGWLWWEAGEGSCCGALDTWGSLLSFQPAKPPAQESPPSLEAPTGESVTAGSTLSFWVNATDPDLPAQNLTLSCAGCPDGASFPTVTGLGQVSGLFAWTPNNGQAGRSYNVTFTVSDGTMNSNATVSITVYVPNNPPNRKPPILTIPGNQTVIVTDVLLFNVTATDPNSPPGQLTLSCVNCNDLGATFTTSGMSPSTGSFRWGPGDNRPAQGYAASFTVTDGTNSSRGTVAINVIRAFPAILASVSPSTLTLGSSPLSASDTVTLSNGFYPGGNISFSIFDKPVCTGPAVFTGHSDVRNGNGAYLSPPFQPQTNGTYYWVADYTGDSNNNPSSTQCGAPMQTLAVYPAGSQPPSQPQSQPPSDGSSPLSPIVLWLTGTGIAVSASTSLAWGLRRWRRSKRYTEQQ